jgi:hypothetical protein
VEAGSVIFRELRRARTLPSDQPDNDPPCHLATRTTKPVARVTFADDVINAGAGPSGAVFLGPVARLGRSGG